LKATGNAPIMKKKKWAVDPERKIGWIIEFMKKYLKLDRSEHLVRFKIRVIILQIYPYIKKDEKYIFLTHCWLTLPPGHGWLLCPCSHSTYLRCFEVCA
jgi:hypothetical protein